MTTPTEQLAWRLAGAKRKCSDCRWVKGYFVRLGTESVICTTCGGKGRAYVLPDTVRVPCACCQNPADPCECKLCYGTDNCYPCQGRGHTPSTDLAVWLDAMKRVGYQVDLYSWHDGYRVSLRDQELQLLNEGKGRVALAALQQALARALEAKGVVL